MTHRFYWCIAVSIAMLTLLALALMREDNSLNLEMKFLGVDPEPMAHVRGFTIRTRGDLSSVHAMFAVTNRSENITLWFDTAWIEQWTNSGWRRMELQKSDWAGLDGERPWPPGYGCYYAVPWPPSLGTNDTWRMQVRCGRVPASMGSKLRQMWKGGRQAERVLVTPELKPIEVGRP
jgi:hypothetical protein